MSKELTKKFEDQLATHYLQTIKDLLDEQEINAQQFMHMAVNQIKRNPKLVDVFQKNPASVFSSILTCAEFGLSPTSQMGEAWLIPYGKECQFQIGYQGLTKILYKNPNIQNITSECVYENDEFDYSLGLIPTLHHKPCSINRGELIAVYCVVRFVNQDPIFKVMSIEELKQIQKLSKAGNRSVWFSPNDPQNWMLKKTCFKQLCKLLPKTLNMSKVVSYDNIIEGGGAMRLDDDNNPLVVEEVKETKASKFEQAMEEDMPGFEGTKEALDDLCDIREDKTKPLIEKCPVPGVDAIGISIPSSKATQIEEGLDHKGEEPESKVVFDDRDGTPTMRDEKIPTPEELIPEIKEDESADEKSEDEWTAQDQLEFEEAEAKKSKTSSANQASHQTSFLDDDI